jgi:hypothetical protein
MGRMGRPVREDSNGGASVFRAGYHFSRFRRGNGIWRRLYVQDIWKFPDKRAEARRKLKLMVIYYMGILLMTVGFLICFNAAFRTSPSQRMKPADITPGIGAESDAGLQDSGFTVLEGQGVQHGRE